jgi:hypothetical protein
MKFKDTFQSPYDQYAHRVGQPFTVLRKITRRNATEVERQEYDPEILPVYRIRFGDGEDITAWPEEVETESCDAS